MQIPEDLHLVIAHMPSQSITHHHTYFHGHRFCQDVCETFQKKRGEYRRIQQLWGLANRCEESQQLHTAVGTSYYVAPEVLNQKLGWKGDRIAEYCRFRQPLESLDHFYLFLPYKAFMSDLPGFAVVIPQCIESWMTDQAGVDSCDTSE